METIVAYFETIPSWHRALILAGGITFFWLIENARPFASFSYRKWHHAGINLFFTGTTILVNFVMAFLLLQTAEWATAHEIGVLKLMSGLPLWLYTLVGLLILDLVGAYFAHLFEHKISVLWRFHLIHHTDTWMDTTSANRHHPGESVIRFVFTIVGTFLAGAPMWMVFMYQSLSVVFSQFSHANIQLPLWLDRTLRYVLVSPDMHKVHHHHRLPYTDSNYGNIFSLWDRLFGTYRELPAKEVVYGIDTHPDEREHNRLGELLRMPFRPKRPPTRDAR
ncbi:MAG TPA: sterol desaturase family protein [Flavobacterium sp.]|nr:sterol desaturase family protein [Flavobacterium sp.]